MIQVFAGDNAFTLQSELHRLSDAFVAEHGDLALERIDAQEASYEQIAEALTSLPFLASKKLIILRAPSTNKSFLEKFEQLLAEIPETTEVIIIEPKLDKRLTYYKYLKKLSGFHEFSELDPQGLAQWLANEAKERDGQLSTTDARFLVERVGINQQLLANELEKLLLYDPQISRSSIELLCEATPQSTIFQLMEAAFAGNHKRALELYAEQRALKIEPAEIIALLAWQLRVLAVIKVAGERTANQIASEAKLSPFVVQKSQGIARKLSPTQLKTMVKNLLTIDMKTKRTSLDADEALQHYLLTLHSA